MDRDHALACEIERDEISGCLQGHIAVVYDHRGVAIENACSVSPLFGGCIGCVVFPNLALSLLAKLRDQVEFDVVSQHRADGIEVSDLEPLYIRGQSGEHSIRQHWQ